MRIKRGKKSQVTIFVIIAIVIVALLILLLNTKIRNSITDILVASKPDTKLQNCLEQDLKEAVQKIANRGGSINPGNYYLYNDEKIEYLCYTNQYHQTCIMQQPMLKEHFERELKEELKDKINICVNNMVKELESKGYNVQESKRTSSAEIDLNKISILVSGVSAEKDEAGEKYDNFAVTQQSEMYNLIVLANSILNFEARYGDSEIVTFMLYYPNVKVEKLKQSDGSKIYILTSGEDKLTFATRSLSWPPGYGIEQEVFQPLR